MITKKISDTQFEHKEKERMKYTLAIIIILRLSANLLEKHSSITNSNHMRVMFGEHLGSDRLQNCWALCDSMGLWFFGYCLL